MNLSDLGEFGFIHRIQPDCIVAPDRVIQGIGDDCAVTVGYHGSLHLVTTDLLVERVHFLADSLTPFQLGQKALAVNLSDIAAMGGTPLDAYVSVGIPEQVSLGFLDDLYRGLKAMASRFGVNLLGGDTTGSKQDLFINVVVTGTVEREHVLYRRGARPGDGIFLSGTVGDAGAGLHAIQNGNCLDDDNAAFLARCHNEPTPHIAVGKLIGATQHAHAMIDVSDGVDADLGHICDESGVGCVIDSDLLPLSAPLKNYCIRFDLDPVFFALAGGEDYVLLCTGDEALPAILSEQDVEISRIGYVTEDRARILRYKDGTQRPLKSTGWDHFRSQS